ncbi:MAG: hypothetical protein AAGF87_00180 [Bacteroidota bacterium]
MFLAFPPILGGTGPKAYLVLAIIVVLVLALFYLVYRLLREDVE